MFFVTATVIALFWLKFSFAAVPAMAGLDDDGASQAPSSLGFCCAGLSCVPQPEQAVPVLPV